MSGTLYGNVQSAQKLQDQSITSSLQEKHILFFSQIISVGVISSESERFQTSGIYSTQ